MLELREFYLKDVVLYKEARFKFTPGITNVQAVNLNRPGRGSNYSGKSLLFTSLVNVMKNTEPLITKNAKTHTKDIFAKKSEVGLTLVKDKHVFGVVKKRTKTTIDKNGKPLDLRTQALANDYIDRLINTNEEEFFTLYYIDSRRPSSFQFGTSVSRFDFFTSLFRLNDVDETRKWFRQQANELKKSQSVADRVKDELKELGKEKDVGDLADKVTKGQEWQKSLTREARTIQKQLHLVEMYRMYKPLKEKYDTLFKETGSTNPRKEAREIDEQLDKLEHQRDKATRAKERADQRDRLQAKLDGVKLSSRFALLSDRKLQRILDLIEKKRRSVGDLPRKPKSVEEPKLKKVRRLLAEHDDFKGLNWIKIQSEAAKRKSKAEGKVSSAKEEAAEFESHFGSHSKEAECPTCKTSLSSNALKSVRAAFSRDLAKGKRDVQIWDRIERASQQYLDFVDAVEQQEKYQTAKRVLAKLDKYPVDAIAEVLRLRSRISDLPSDAPVRDTTGDEKKLRKRKESLLKLSSLKGQLGDFKDVDELKEAKALDPKKLKRKQEQIDEELNELLKKLPKLQSELDQVTEHNKRRRKLKREYKELTEALKDLKLYEAMADAYSTAGFKHLLIKKIAQMVERNMNHYAKFLYQEQYTFELRVNTNAFDALVTRKGGLSDIRRMSGAESRIFSLLFALSILPFIPKERRFNFMILDEPGENLDAGMLQIFRDVLLPELAKIIPSVVVISPKDEFVTASTRLVTVVKQGAHSRLIEGKYDAANQTTYKAKKRA